ncbi:hypothetical protein BDBG_16576 [Blastomyces gilchristii SLH14081]|uniref:Uncharacterized protein n=1 Tax=Blastomyces gilchristii (strain SLH14081) TaxID=559298 RepID=A0A179UGP7_BLAGS|nr:uncharacterized protein BDBG_16576 [Blastomyces gilchristii SLH14081]OAT06191.1 hypothetical protein BDBG_16576 [Blastomyces gilchristii SLH14081]
MVYRNFDGRASHWNWTYVPVFRMGVFDLATTGPHLWPLRCLHLVFLTPCTGYGLDCILKRRKRMVFPLNPSGSFRCTSRVPVRDICSRYFLPMSVASGCRHMSYSYVVLISSRD